MSCHIVMEFTLKPSEVARFKALLVRHLPDARTFDGCRSAQVFENQDDADIIVIVEHWQSRTHFEKYIEWRTSTGVLAELVAYCAFEPSMRVFDLVDA